MSRTVNWPMDCSSKRLTGNPARTRLSRTLRSLLIPRFLKLEKLKHHIIVNISTKGTTNTIEGSCVGLVPINKPNNTSPAMLEIIIDLFILLILYLYSYCIKNATKDEPLWH